MEHLFLVAGATASPATDTSLPTEELRERQHLQEWILSRPQILGEDVLVVTSEYDKWASEVDDVTARERLDILGLDASGRLVVAELKRASADRDIHLQAITYAALVSRFDAETLAVAHRDYLVSRGADIDVAGARQRLESHVGGAMSPEVLARPRLVLVASSFPRQVTHSVVWLSEMGLDIDLTQVRLWRVGDQLVAGFSKVYPTPEVEEFTLAPARESAAAVVKSAEQKTRAKNAVHLIVGSGLLPSGAALRMRPRHGVTEGQRALIHEWVKADARRGQAQWMNDTTKPLRWAADGGSYSATGLAQRICAEALGMDISGIQGTTWWIVAERLSVSAANGGTWSAMTGKSLVGLADEARSVVPDAADAISATEAQ